LSRRRGEKKSIKGQLIYVIEAKRGFQMKDVEAHCKNAVPPTLQGSIDWPPEE